MKTHNLSYFHTARYEQAYIKDFFPTFFSTELERMPTIKFVTHVVTHTT